MPGPLLALLLVAAAVVWLAACSGGAPAASPPTPTAAARVPTLAPGNTGPQQGVAPPGSQAKDASPGAGETPKAGSPPAAATAGQVRPQVLAVSDKGQGGIAVVATWVVPGSKEASSSELDRYLAFSLALDTHSGDLGQYNLAKLSVLRDDQGKEVAPAVWQTTSEDSHHRAGVLKFARGPEQGSKYLELVIREVGGVKERVLKWDLGQ